MLRSLQDRNGIALFSGGIVALNRRLMAEIPTGIKKAQLEMTLHLTPYTLHLTPYTLHLTPYALRLTPYTLASFGIRRAALNSMDWPHQ